MSKMVKNLFGGGGKERIIEATKQDNAEAKAKQDTAVAVAREDQNRAVADTEQSVGRARRTPRGRRQLIGNENTRLG